MRDMLDRDILFHLQANARQSATELARKLKVARSTVQERISRLERDGVIGGYTALVRPDPSERMVRALVYIAVEQADMGAVVERLRQLPEVTSCSAMSGAFDLLTTLVVPDVEDLDAVLSEMAAIDGVRRTRSDIVLASKFSRPAVSVPPLGDPSVAMIGA